MEAKQLSRTEIADWLFAAGISQGYTMPVYFYIDSEGNFSVENESEMEAMGFTAGEMEQFQHITPCDYF